MPLVAMTGREASRILVAHRYYYPDTPPYAAILHSIVGRWRDDGHIVDVLSSRPSYKTGVETLRADPKEVSDEGKITRLGLPSEVGRPAVRVLNALRLCRKLFFDILIHGRYAVVMVSTSPPVAAAFVAALACRLSGTKFIYHVMDIHPEVGRISGEFSNALIYRLLRKADDFSCRMASSVVVLSEDMEAALRARSRGSEYRIVVTNNFSMPSPQCSHDIDQISISPDTFTVLFAGNIGRFQGLEVLIDGMARLKERRDIELVIMGDGAERATLERRAVASGGRIRFVGHRSANIAKDVMAQADLGFVSLVPGIYQYAYPSKTTTYLEQGCPVLASLERESSLALEIVAAGIGIVVEPNSSVAVANAISDLADCGERVEVLKSAAMTYGPQHFSVATGLERWSTTLADILNE